MSKQTVAVIDYGMGNLHSAASAVSHAAPEAEVIITSDPAAVRRAGRIIFPGVGAIRDCVGEINRLGFGELLREQLAEGKPTLGICVGLQALMDASEENRGVDCLGILPGRVRFFGEGLRDERGEPMKVPHMGWNRVEHDEHPLWQGIPQHSRFYFVHSYYVQAADDALVSGTCDYSVRFAAALARDNLFAVQFHPEKSHTAGLRLLRNFVHWDGVTP